MPRSSTRRLAPRSPSARTRPRRKRRRGAGRQGTFSRRLRRGVFVGESLPGRRRRRRSRAAPLPAKPSPRPLPLHRELVVGESSSGSLPQGIPSGALTAETEPRRPSASRPPRPLPLLRWRERRHSPRRFDATGGSREPRSRRFGERLPESRAVPRAGTPGRSAHSGGRTDSRSAPVRRSAGARCRRGGRSVVTARRGVPPEDPGRRGEAPRSGPPPVGSGALPPRYPVRRTDSSGRFRQPGSVPAVGSHGFVS